VGVLKRKPADWPLTVLIAHCWGVMRDWARSTELEGRRVLRCGLSDGPHERKGEAKKEAKKDKRAIPM
jgi:hypothetical protein